jgi:RimJ/RimL family protein N-acetyltransferase
LAGWIVRGLRHRRRRERCLPRILRVGQDHREGLEAEIGYITAPAARGRGIATRALVLISDWALTVGGLRRVELKIDYENPASQRVAERAGFTREGTLHSVHFKQGRRTDFHVYARIA